MNKLEGILEEVKKQVNRVEELNRDLNNRLNVLEYNTLCNSIQNPKLNIVEDYYTSEVN